MGITAEREGGDPSSSTSPAPSDSDSVSKAEPEISFAKWMKDLHLALVCCSEQGEEHVGAARALCGCWYYHASETCFVEGGEEESNSLDEEEDTTGKRRRTPLASYAEEEEMIDEDEDEDDEYEPTGDDDDNDDDDDEEGDDEDDEVEGEEEEGESVSGLKRAASEEGAPDAKKQKNSGAEYVEELKGEPEEGATSKAAMMGVIADLLANSGGDEEAVTDEQEEESEQEIREVILGAVKKLHAYMPSPATHLAYYKRMTKKMVTLCQGGSEHELRWFPWGVPPMETILEVCQDPNTGEELKKDMAMNLVLLNNFFAPLDDEDDEED